MRKIFLRKIYATNSKETLEVEIREGNKIVRASAPRGTSKGKYEAFSLPFEICRKNFLKLKKALEQKEFSNVYEVDEFLKKQDGTENWSKIGGNLSLAISLAFLKLFAEREKTKLYQYVSSFFKHKPKIPIPICNVIGGGKHGGKTEFQEILFFGKGNFISVIERIFQAYHELGKEIKKIDKNFHFQKNLESAWSCNLSWEKAIELAEKVAKSFSLKLGIDVAASSFWDGRYYKFDRKKLSPEQAIEFFDELLKKYRIIQYLEDPFHEDDFSNFSLLTKKFKKRLIVGDDIFVTNVKRLRKNVANAAIVKFNQVGCVSEGVEFIKKLESYGMKKVFSHRSAETEDVWLVHLSVGFGADLAKVGVSGERIVKINEFVRIWKCTA